MPFAVVLASHNAGKIQEFQELLAEQSFNVIPQAELGISDIEETGLTFIENAILKARHASAKSGLPALADDSGLEVDALGGEPGVFSARYAGEPVDMARNRQKLLERMRDVPAGKRSARFHCVLALMRHARDPNPLICHGTWEGEVLFAEQGTRGFGYDSLFYVPTHRCSAAELSVELKHQLSHRGQALRQLLSKNLLNQYLDPSLGFSLR